MKFSIDIHRAARIVIDHYGEGARDHADRMLKQNLENGDRECADMWLAIGQALELFAVTLPTDPTVH